MAKYRVCVESVDYLYIDIEADSPEEAKEFADQNVDGGEFHGNSTDVDWRYTDVIELDDSAEVDYSAYDNDNDIEIYENAEDYYKNFEYWSNACGDLHHNDKWLDSVDDLPSALKDAYERLWEEGCGSYCYLCSYKGDYGVALINEYHQFTDEGKVGEKNNYQQAVKVAEALKAQNFPISIFIGKEMGFPGKTPDGVEGDDQATELVAFMKTDVTKEQFNEVAEWLLKNAYVS